jgi:hypothetical protein
MSEFMGLIYGSYEAKVSLIQVGRKWRISMNFYISCYEVVRFVGYEFCACFELWDMHAVNYGIYLTGGGIPSRWRHSTQRHDTARSGCRLLWECFQL